MMSSFIRALPSQNKSIAIALALWSLNVTSALFADQVIGGYEYYWYDDGAGYQEFEEPDLRLTSDDQANDVHIDLGFKFALPEGSGLELQIQPSPYWAVSVHGMFAPKIKVNYSIPSKFLLSESAYAIEQPNLSLPIDVAFGPHYGAGLSIFPFQGTFYLAGALQRRVISLSSSAESPVNFLNSETRIESNSVLYAEAKTHTSQTIAKFEFGQRVPFAFEKMYFSWFAGISAPVASQSNQFVNIELRNSKATNPSEGVADNFQDKEVFEEAKAENELSKMLKDLEHLILPTAGISIGWRW